MSLSGLALASILTLFGPQDRGSSDLDRAFRPCPIFGTAPGCPPPPPPETFDQAMGRFDAEPAPPCVTLPPLTDSQAALADRARRAASQRYQDRDPDLAGLLRALPGLKASVAPHRTCASFLAKAEDNRDRVAAALQSTYPRCVSIGFSVSFAVPRIDEGCLARSMPRRPHARYLAASERWAGLRLDSPEQRLLIGRYNALHRASTDARDYQTLPSDAF